MLLLFVLLLDLIVLSLSDLDFDVSLLVRLLSTADLLLLWDLDDLLSDFSDWEPLVLIDLPKLVILDDTYLTSDFAALAVLDSFLSPDFSDALSGSGLFTPAPLFPDRLLLRRAEVWLLEDEALGPTSFVFARLG